MARYLLAWVALCVLCVASCGDPPTKACADDGACPKGQICEKSSCVVGCRRDESCPQGLRCIEARCSTQQCAPGESRPCYDGPTGTAGIGSCKQGAQFCSQGNWSLCTQQSLPGTEICDNVDNDCNGKVDELPGGCNCPTPGQEQKCYDGPVGTLGVGVCKVGVQSCRSDNVWGACRNAVKPSPEICDEKDNDCNGKIDDLPKEQKCECEFGASRVCEAQKKDPSGVIVCIVGTRTCTQQKSWTECQGKTFSTQDSTAHCGACGKACPSGVSCIQGKCQCPDGKVLCEGACISPTSTEHCGKCGNRCPTDGICDQGKCACKSGQIPCKDACITPDTAEHCGACGKACPSGVPCIQGKCQCPDGKVFCEGACILPNTVKHCGKCGLACARDQACGAGVCAFTSQAIGGDGAEFIESIAIDASDHLYVFGSFEKLLALGSVRFTSKGGSDVFVAKFAPDGKMLWATAAGDTSNEYAYGIAVDPKGIYITGKLSGPSTFGSFKMSSGTASGDRGIFVARLNHQGSFVWAKSFAGKSYSSGKSIAVNPKGGLYLLGDLTGDRSASNSVAFDGVQVTTKSGASNDVFLASLDDSGKTLWVRTLGGGSFDLGTDLAVDASGNAYITGHIQGKSQIGKDQITPNGARDFFLVKYDPSGDILWKHTGGGGGKDTGYGLALDGKGGLYLLASLSGLYAIAGKSFSTPNGDTQNPDALLLRFDANTGAFQWGANYGGKDSDEGRDISIAPNGDIYITGQYRGVCTFGPFTLTSNGGADVFFARINPKGDVVHAMTVGGASDERAGGIAHSSKGTTFFAGFFSQSLKLKDQSLTGNPIQDIFLISGNW